MFFFYEYQNVNIIKNNALEKGNLFNSGKEQYLKNMLSEDKDVPFS